MYKKEDTYPLLQAMPLPGILLQPVGDCLVIIDANKSYLELVQAEPQELIGIKACGTFPHNPDQKGDPVLLFQSLQRVASTGQKEQLDLRYDLPKQGTDEYQEKYWSCENIPVFGEKGNIEAVLHVVKDMTSQVLAEKQRQQLESQQRYFIEKHSDGLYTLDVNGKFLSGNDGLAAIAEVPLPELLKMNFLPFCHPEDQDFILQHFEKAITGEATKFEARFISAMGRHMILHINLVPMKVGEQIGGVYGIARDITSIRESQQVIVEKRSFLKANSAFISSLLENENLENEALQEVFAIVGKAVAVDRMYYFSSHTKPGTGQLFLSQQLEWCSEKARPQIDNPDLQEIPAKELQQLWKLPSRNAPYIAFPDEMEEGMLKRLFQKQDIKSVLILPIFLQDELNGFIGFDDCTRKRQWSEEEITFLQSLANNLTAALEKRAVRTALKEQEEALKSSEKKFRALVEQGSELIAILDEHGNFKFISDTASRESFYASQDILGRSCFDFVYSEDQPAFEEKLQQLKEGEQTKIGPFRFRDKDGNLRWLEATATNLLHEPAINGIVVNSRDITTLVNQAREIEHINERYRLAATATRDLMYDWDLVTDKVERFHKSKSFVGYNVEETNNRTFWRDHVHPEELEGLRQHLAKTLNDPSKSFINTEYRFRRSNGTYAQFLDRAYIIRDTNGKAIRLVGATSDISELTAQKEALKVANKRFKMAMKATNEMIWDWNLATDHVARSKAFKKIYGYNKYQEHPNNAYWMEKIHIDERDAVAASVQAALKDPNQDKWRAEYRFIRASGDVSHVIDRGYILRDETGKAVRVVGAVLDVTHSKQALRKIEEQNKRLKEIAWEQSHLVRAPLVRLQGLMELVKSADFSLLSHEEAWEHMEASAEELDQIIRNIVKKTEAIEGAYV